LDILDYLITNIKPLPWIVKGPGLGLMALLLLRAVTQFLTLRWIKAATSIVYAAIVVLGMARFGDDIAGYIQDKSKAPITGEKTGTVNQTGQN
jgi:hypothetical protein